MLKKSVRVEQPTFFEIPEVDWDEERDKPRTITAYDIETVFCGEIPPYMKKYAIWKAGQNNPTEAEARQAYAAHMAQYLVGIFPQTRVNAAAYSAAVGEELGEFSADIVRMTGQRARRTCKTLPSVAQLWEWANAEGDRRDRQYVAYKNALEAYDRAIRKGQEEAARIADCAAAHGLVIDPATILGIYNALTLYPLGIEHSDFADCARVARSLFRRISQGDAAVLPLALDIIQFEIDLKSYESECDATREKAKIQDCAAAPTSSDHPRKCQFINSYETREILTFRLAMALGEQYRKPTRYREVDGQEGYFPIVGDDGQLLDEPDMAA